MSVQRWEKLITKYARKFKLEPHLVAGIIEVESAGDPAAVSPKGAVGLMQVMPGELIPGRPSAEILKDPERNIEAGCSILRSMLDRYQNRACALAAYCGALRGGLPTETGWAYVNAVERAASKFLHLSACDEDFSEYAPLSGTWREAATNLKGIATAALERGRLLQASLGGIAKAVRDHGTALEKLADEMISAASKWGGM
jgi:hypothetical protein